MLLLITLYPVLMHAWTGYDYDTDDCIEIDEDVSAIQSKDIEIYDYSDESYNEAYVILVSNNGKEIDVFDHDTGDCRTVEAETDNGQTQSADL